jgi:hypothetical protein
MIPSPLWFPTSMGERADWYNVFYTQLVILAATIDVTLSEVTMIENDNQMMQFMLTSRNEMEVVKEAANSFRKNISEGSIGSPDPVWPDAYAGTPPLPQVPPGMFERLVKLVERIRTANGYTNEIGELLQIVPKKSDALIPDELQPNPSLKALPGNVVKVEFVRGKTQGIEIEYKLDKDENWTKVGRFASSPAELIIPANVDNTARTVQIRARYVLNNVAVGLYSEIDTISTMP